MRAIYLLLCLLFSQITWANERDLMLLSTYENQDIQGWVMSEKLDGIRGYWDGKALFSERNQFEEIASITKSLKGDNWAKLTLYVFDVPNASGNLFERLQILEDYLKNNPTSYIKIIPQIPIRDKTHLFEYLHEIERKKGEGVVLRNPNAPYERKRSTQILKLKSTYDEECMVIEHHKGKGQFENILGSLTCENHRGKFKIGSGFNLSERENPPPIGTTITYKYRGLTNSGKPRFATYWREKK